MRNKIKNCKEAESFLLHLVDYVSDASDLSNDELKKELANEDVDPDVFVSRVKSRVRKELDRQRLGWMDSARLKKQQLLNNMSGIVAEANEIMQGRDQILSEIKRMVRGNEYAIEFRELQGKSDEDLISLYKDLKALSSQDEE